MSSDQALLSANGVRVLVGSDMFGYTLYCGESRIYVYREALPALMEQLAHFLVTQGFEEAVIGRLLLILSTDRGLMASAEGE